MEFVNLGAVVYYQNCKCVFCYFLACIFTDIDLLNIQCIDIMIEVINFLDWFYQARKNGGLEGKAGILRRSPWASSLVYLNWFYHVTTITYKGLTGENSDKDLFMEFEWCSNGDVTLNIGILQILSILFDVVTAFPQPLFSWEQLDIRARARSFFVLPWYLTVALSGPGGPRVI